MNDEQIDMLYRKLIASYGEKTMEALDHLSRRGGGMAPLVAQMGNGGQGIEESVQVQMGVMVFVGEDAMKKLNTLTSELFEKRSPDNVSESLHTVDFRNHDHG